MKMFGFIPCSAGSQYLVTTGTTNKFNLFGCEFGPSCYAGMHCFKMSEVFKFRPRVGRILRQDVCGFLCLFSQFHMRDSDVSVPMAMLIKLVAVLLPVVMAYTS